ncbi:flavin monoamine oxidase family protein [Baekduia sp. Peel2402]|uniref:flavin monoamine oxidase family protein n=1 Tax=Baekduia sp. Peel2402 TaxID=3458296 RepID=UPI00403E5ADD
MREVDVVVVGAGLAGLAAARALVGAGRDVVVLEGRDRVGGRTLNERVGDGASDVVELGGQWVGPTQTRLMALARELGVETYPTFATGESLFAWGGKVRRYRGTIPRINPMVLADVGQAMARLNRMAKTVPLDAPWTAKRAAAWDAQTFATWMGRNLATPGGRAILQMAVEGVWATDPSEPSLLHVLFYIHSAGSLELLTDTEGGAQQDRFVGGSQLLSLKMAEALGEERVVLGATVRAIEQDAGGVTVRGDGVELRARHAIVAIPVPLTARIAWTPALPHARDALTQRMAMGSVVKCMAIYDEPFWRAEGLSGTATDADGPVKVMFDNTPPGGRPGVLLGFFEGRAAQVAMRATQDERRAQVTQTLARLFGPRAAKPERYVDLAWGQEELTRGCYGAYLPPGGWTGFGAALRAPVGRVHWAGAETALVWNGYMDGAVTSGEAAASAVLAAAGAA